MKLNGRTSLMLASLMFGGLVLSNALNRIQPAEAAVPTTCQGLSRSG